VSSKLREIANETIGILDTGRYRVPDGGEVSLTEDIGRAVAGTRLYLPDDQLPPAASPATASARIEVTAETTLTAARRLGGDVACLVFASAKHPGGGFRSGAQAQEESLARASALYACQSAVPDFYAFHGRQQDLRYSDRIIYSPAVPVFRDDDGTLLARPYPVTFLTAAAPNLGAIAASQPGAAGSVPSVLSARAGASPAGGGGPSAPPARPWRLGLRRVRQRSGGGRHRVRPPAQAADSLRPHRVRCVRPHPGHTGIRDVPRHPYPQQHACLNHLCPLIGIA
jgi:uncharacterized protein (TIGR02452 family)